MYNSKSPKETLDIAKKFAEELKPGDGVFLIGDLGFGKTCFASGVALALSIKEKITSPTFSIVNEYLNGTLPLFHFDLYRLISNDKNTNNENLENIGFFDYLEKDGICLIEWGEDFNIEKDFLRTFFVTIKKGNFENERFIEIKKLC